MNPLRVVLGNFPKSPATYEEDGRDQQMSEVGAFHKGKSSQIKTVDRKKGKSSFKGYKNQEGEKGLPTTSYVTVKDT